MTQQQELIGAIRQVVREEVTVGLEELRTDTAARFDKVDQRFDKVDQRLDGLDHRVDTLAEEVADLRIVALETRADLASFRKATIGSLNAMHMDIRELKIDKLRRDNERRARGEDN